MLSIKNIILTAILLLTASGLALANDSPIQDMLDTFNPNEGKEAKTFDLNNGDAQVKIKWNSDNIDYQLLYKKIPPQLMNYFNNPLQEPSAGAVTIHFFNKDGFEITQRPCYITNFTYDKDDNGILCKNPVESFSMHSDIDEYRRITNANISIN